MDKKKAHLEARLCGLHPHQRFTKIFLFVTNEKEKGT